MTSITVSTWNVCTLFGKKQAERPERRIALITHELKRYNLPIVALSETCYADEGYCLLLLVQGVWVTAGRVAACPLPNVHVAVSS